ncbi:hypothetical protein TRICI_004651 [Trichomonascus ciferrii]|uniref:Sfi1 spindle body domain-containing protein n=1 Tax=Trichomonascus ciferrii TaxID=44093 RepID=A0A642V0G0_9ASCO|nr:hypothetical protein TRICI_004651 [Trichomonascus ciferrii]
MDDLRRRREAEELTRYDPDHGSSDNNSSEENVVGNDPMDEEDEDDDNVRDWAPPIRRRWSRRPANGRSIRLDEETIELLRLIAETADNLVDRGRVLDNNTDFPTFFQAFKAFMEKNNYDKQSVVYNHCMNIMVGLCNYHEPTWSDRLEHCLEDHSLAERRRLRKEHLQGQYNDFTGLIKGRFLYSWYDRMIERQNQMAMAEFKDATHLRREVLSRWVYRLRMNRENTRLSIQYSDERITSRCLDKWLIRMNRLEAQRSQQEAIIKKRFLNRWKTQYNDIRAMEEIADERYKRYLKSSHLVDWIYQAMETKMSSDMDRQLLKECLDIWIAFTRHTRLQSDQAIGQDETKLVSANFYTWKEQSDKVLDDYLVAQEMSDVYTAKHILQSVKRAGHLSKLEREHCAKYGASRKKDIFGGWRQRTLQVKEAKRFRDFMLCMRMFETWRRETGCQVIARFVDYDIAKAKFRLWLLAERESVFRRYREGLFARSILEHWINKTADVRINVQESYQTVHYDTSKRLLRGVLISWKARHQRLQKLNEQAEDFRVDKLLSLGFKTIRTASHDLSLLDHEAERIDSFNTLRKTLRHWKDYTHRHKKTRLENVCSAWIAKQEKDIQQKVIEHWIGKLWDIENQDGNADAVFSANQMKRARSVLHLWQQKLKSIQADYSRADAIYSNSILSSHMMKWIDRKTQVDRSMEEAGFIADIKDLEKQEAMFRTWRMKMFKLESKNRDADLFLDRLRTTRFRRIWRLWRAKTSDAAATVTAISSENNENTSSQDSEATMTVTKPPQEQSNPLLETPTRVRSRKRVQFTSVDRWRKIKGNGPPTFSPTKATPVPTSTPATNYTPYKTPQLNDEHYPEIIH